MGANEIVEALEEGNRMPKQWVVGIVVQGLEVHVAGGARFPTCPEFWLWILSTGQFALLDLEDKFVLASGIGTGVTEPKFGYVERLPTLPKPGYTAVAFLSQNKNSHRYPLFFSSAVLIILNPRSTTNRTIAAVCANLSACRARFRGK
jgi:hypothetical protein